ncbi:MAG: helix-turn-helix domain-containing protein, partial [Pseudomonadales bacterium]
MSERKAFIDEWLDRGCGVGELCRRYGVSRKTGHKWIKRYRTDGPDALADHSRARLTQAHETPDRTVRLILNMKRDNHSWGPVTIHSALHRLYPEAPCPARSTIGEILRRHNLVKPRKRRRRAPPCTQPLAHATSPNVSWSADFMGQFPMGNG